MYDIFCGVPQGSILGPILGTHTSTVFNTQKPKNTEILCYGNNAVLIVTEITINDLKNRVEVPLSKIHAKD